MFPLKVSKRPGASRYSVEHDVTYDLSTNYLVFRETAQALS